MGAEPEDHYIIYSLAHTPFLTDFSIEPQVLPLKPSMQANITIEGVTGNCGAPEAKFFVAVRYGPEVIPYYYFDKIDGKPELSGTYLLDHENELDVSLENYEYHMTIDQMGFAYYNNFQGTQLGYLRI